MNDQLLQQIQQGKGLNKVETNDRSVPQIDPNTTVGQNQHGQLLGEIQQGTQLKPVETHDRSVPQIDPNTKVGQNSHGQLMDEIKSLKRED